MPPPFPLKPHQVHFVLFMFYWMCDTQLEHGHPTRDHNLKKWTLLLEAINCSLAKVRSLCSSLFHAGIFYRSIAHWPRLGPCIAPFSMIGFSTGLVQVVSTICKFICATALLYPEDTLSLPCTTSGSENFPPLLPQQSLCLRGRVCDRDVPFLSMGMSMTHEHSVVFFSSL